MISTAGTGTAVGDYNDGDGHGDDGGDHVGDVGARHSRLSGRVVAVLLTILVSRPNVLLPASDLLRCGSKVSRIMPRNTTKQLEGQQIVTIVAEVQFRVVLVGPKGLASGLN